MRQLVWMAEPRREWLRTIVRAIAASVGVDLGDAGRGDVLPYNPAMLQAIAESGKDVR